MGGEETRVRVLVVGGGLAGLAFASFCSESIVFESRKTLGGFSAHDDLKVGKVSGMELVSELSRGINARVGETVFKVEKNGVWALGESGARFHTGTPVLATGFRERTLVELGIYGYRPSGVFPLSAAWDFTNMGYLVGQKILVYGFNHYSLALVSKLSRFAEKIIVIYDEDSYIHHPDELHEFGVEGIRGRVLYVEGRNRLEKVKTTAGDFQVDALVISKLAPLRIFEADYATGNASMIIEDPSKIVESSRLVANMILSKGDTGFVESDLPVTPTVFKLDHPYVMLGVRKGCGFQVNGRNIVAEESYPVIELPKAKRVRIKAV